MSMIYGPFSRDVVERGKYTEAKGERDTEDPLLTRAEGLSCPPVCPCISFFLFPPFSSVPFPLPSYFSTFFSTL